MFSIDQYLEMIKLKTSVLLAASFQIGALIGGASKSARASLNYGLNLGWLFNYKMICLTYTVIKINLEKILAEMSFLRKDIFISKIIIDCK